MVKSWPDAFDLLPECALKEELFQQVKAFAEGLTEAFQQAFMEAFAKTLPNQEQEQEQEQNKYSSANESAPMNSSLKNSPRVKRVKSELSDEELRAVYLAYPRRKALRDAMKAMRSAVERIAKEDGTTQHEALAKLKTRVEAYAKHVKINGTEEQFLPYPATWLNDGCYDDEDLLRLAPKTEESRPAPMSLKAMQFP